MRTARARRAPRGRSLWPLALLHPMAEEILSKLDEQAHDVTIKEEYQLWRKNCRYMYEFVTETALTWPSLTVQWLPEHRRVDGAIEATLLLGTHTSGEDTDYLKVASAQLPGDSGVASGALAAPLGGADGASAASPSAASGAARATPASAAPASARLKITRKFKNTAEINRARYMPQTPLLVATINGRGLVDLYDLGGDLRGSTRQYTPHTANGYGLLWLPFTAGHLLTALDDRSVVVTDTATGAAAFRDASAADSVNDAKFSPHAPHVFCSVLEDNYTVLYDTRQATPALKHHSPDAAGVNSLAFLPFLHHLVAVGLTSANVALLDTRTMAPLHTLMGHTAGVTSLEFSPHRDGVLALASEDRRVILWDLFRIGEEQTQEDAEDGCPELLMMHAGHTGAVLDLAWCPHRDWTLALVADDNIVHLWEVGRRILEEGAQAPPELE